MMCNQYENTLNYYICRINSSSVVLSNFEVLQTLQNIKDTKNKHGLRNLATIMYEVCVLNCKKKMEYQIN